MEAFEEFLHDEKSTKTQLRFVDGKLDPINFDGFNLGCNLKKPNDKILRDYGLFETPSSQLSRAQFIFIRNAQSNANAFEA